MPKKARTPDPPRRAVQAPRPRAGGKKAGYLASMSDAERRRLLMLVAIGAVGLVGLAVVLGFLVTRGGGPGKAAELVPLFRQAGCTYSARALPNEGRDHTSDLNARIKYKTFPPTSGRHYETPIPWDTYPTAVSQVQAVHNLEHGGIVVQYGAGVPPATVEELRAFVADDPRGMLLAPLPSLRKKIALTAWRRLATCTAYDEPAFKGFRDVFRAKGPERFPLDALEPRG